MLGKKGQVWIETVLYTLIGLVLMGLVLAFVMPKINEMRDNAIVEQAISTLNVMDSKINEVIQRGAENIRESEFSLKRGELYINSTTDEIIFALDGLTKPYSESGVEIRQGRIYVLSTKGAKTSSVILKLKYNANITYDGRDENKKLTAAATPYKFFIKNEGIVNNKEWVDIKEASS